LLPPATTAPKEVGSPAADKKGESEHVTYLPSEGDPIKTTWMGITFHANVPKEVTNQALIAKAKQNRFFKVGDFNPARDRVSVENTPLPKTSEQYRAHAVAWIKTVESVDDLDTRWQSEETLRMHCGVGTDDIEWLQDFLGPKRHELKRRGLPG